MSAYSDIPHSTATRELSIPAGRVNLTGDLALPSLPSQPSQPSHAPGLVLFAHGSGSSRHSPRNRFVAAELQRAGMATLLFDLLTSQEEIEEQSSGHLRFNIDLISERLLVATRFITQEPATRELPLAYFGASTGAAAALVAATRAPAPIAAIVSRGGRPDLAGDALANVKSPTLLIVGADDEIVVELNREALAQLTCEKRLELVPGATHLFEESGALEQVTSLAIDWFSSHLRSSAD